ncbi:reverse transcriptase domain-containing protein [Tanacetum coccineum]
MIGSLADLGASINLMPLSVFEKLNRQGLTKTRMVLELADRSISTPTGIAEDVFVKVGTFYFPAIMSVYELNLKDMYDQFRGLQSRFLGLSTSKWNFNPYSEPIVDTTSPTLTPFEGSDFILEEIEAELSDTLYKSRIDDAECDPENDILLLEAILNSEAFYHPLPNHANLFSEV